MASRPRLKDRLLTLLTTLGAVAFFVVGVSRGNLRVAVIGALFFLGYGVLHGVTRRLEPAARLVTGSEVDQAERLVQFRATRLAGQGALVVAAAGVLAEFTVQWEPGIYVAGTALLVLAIFVGGLWFFSRAARR
jgi:hypothetical protein